MDDPLEDEDNALVKITSLLVLGAGLVALFMGYGWFWIVFAVGFAVVVPLVKTIVTELNLGTSESRESPTEAARPTRDGVGTSDRWDSTGTTRRDALETLRERYAQGELSEAEFERKLETLLETETLEDARDIVERERRRADAEARNASDEPDGVASATDDGRTDESRDDDRETRERNRSSERNE